MRTPRELEQLYREGCNIIALLQEEGGEVREYMIEVSYDLQAGSYVDGMNDPEVADLKRRFSAELGRVILSLTTPRSVLEAGVGEATTLSGVVPLLPEGTEVFGFDLCWSRVAVAKRWLARHGLSRVELASASLFRIPLPSHSIDVVYTAHSIEPNGGQEATILRELYRVTRDYLVLLEPGYELASEEARRRMETHGYCRDLPGTARSLGYDVVRHELFPVNGNPLNPTALTVIRKESSRVSEPAWVCPRYHTALEERDGVLYSPEALRAYPVLGGIPSLRVEHGILASRLADLVDR